MALPVLNWVFGTKPGSGKKPGGRKKPSYARARDIAASGSDQERRELAEHEDLEPEILYYFATDSSSEVRRTVAQNAGTPLQADRILAEDTDADVRAELAEDVPALQSNINAHVAGSKLNLRTIMGKD